MLQQIERRRDPEGAADDRDEASLPLHVATQGDEVHRLHHNAADHHQRHRLGRRQDVQQHGTGDGRERKAREPGDDRAGKHDDAEKEK